MRAGLLRGAARTVIIMSAPGVESRVDALNERAFHHQRVRERDYDRCRLAVEGAWRFDIPSGLPTRRWRFVGFPSARVVHPAPRSFTARPCPRS